MERMRGEGAPGMRPYDLRHAFCSLLIAEACPWLRSPAKQATRRRSRSTPTRTSWPTSTAATECPRRPRCELPVRPRCPESGCLKAPSQRGPPKTPAFPESPPSDSNRKPLHYKCGLAGERRRRSTAEGQRTRAKSRLRPRSCTTTAGRSCRPRYTCSIRRSVRGRAAPQAARGGGHQ
jgi:hypothetical protein